MTSIELPFRFFACDNHHDEATAADTQTRKLLKQELERQEKAHVAGHH